MTGLNKFLDLLIAVSTPRAMKIELQILENKY